jgi:hypothetical protein
MTCNEVALPRAIKANIAAERRASCSASWNSQTPPPTRVAPLPLYLTPPKRPAWSTLVQIANCDQPGRLLGSPKGRKGGGGVTSFRVFSLAVRPEQFLISVSTPGGTREEKKT